MDRNDHQVNLVEFLNKKAPELKPLFKNEFAKNLSTKGGSDVQINYPDSSAGKYIALYGFEDLFKSLPKDIKVLKVINSSNESVELDLPKEIGDFTELKSLLLQNMVKTLPDTIGNLKNLQILSLPNNKSLVSLPESIKDLDKLSFVNLMGGNKKVFIPEPLKSKLVDEDGDQYYYVV